MSEVFNLVNLKGGVGKTVSTINIAYSMSAMGKSVLIIDTDSQGNILTALGRNPDTSFPTLADIMSAAIDGEISYYDVRDCIMRIGSVDVIPANYLLAGLDLKLMNAMAREYVLKGIVEYVRKDYDYILIDSPPSLGVIVMNSLTASDYVLIPVEAQYLSFESLKVMLDTVNITKLKLNPNLNVGIFITKYQSNANICKAILEKTREMYGESVKVFDTPVPYSVRAAEQTLYGKSIVELMPKHKISAAYKQIAKELIGYDR